MISDALRPSSDFQQYSEIEAWLGQYCHLESDDACGQQLFDTYDWESDAGYTVYDTALRLPPVNLAELVAGLTREQIVAKCVTDFNFFSKFMMPDVCKLDYPPLLTAVWRSWIQGLVVTSDSKAEFKAATAIPRGYTKTTMIKLFIAYTVMFTKHSFVVVVGSVDSNAENIVADVMELFGSSQVRTTFGNWDLAIKSNSVELKKFDWLGKRVILKPKGAITSVRGLNIDNRRPEVIILDDVQTEENARSDVESAKLASWIINTLIPTFGSDGGCALFVGNVYPYAGAILNTLRKMRGWTKLILGAILSDGAPLWGELHSLRKIIQSYRDAVSAGQRRAWLAQYMNAIENDVANAANIPAIATNSYLALKELGLGSDPMELLTISDANFIMIDVATNKKGADDHAIVVASSYRGKLFAVAALVDVLSPQQAVAHSISMSIEYMSPKLFVEDVGYQFTFISWWDEKAAESDLASFVTMEPFAPERVNKNDRIVRCIEALNEGEFFIHPNLFQQFKAEVSEFNPAKSNNRDNLLDGIHYLPKVWQKHKESLAYARAQLKLVDADSRYLRKAGIGSSHRLTVPL